MKIAAIETFLADAGWWPWAFVKITTDEGLVGYSEATCPFTQYSVLGAIHDMRPILVGTDPLATEARFGDMTRRARLGSFGGTVSKAIGAIENALLDIKGKALGLSVAQLLGGPTRERIPLYWSHWGSLRSFSARSIGKPPLSTLQDVFDAAKEVEARGFGALKTNLFFPTGGEQAWLDHGGFGGGLGSSDQTASHAVLRAFEALIGTIRDSVGPHIDIIVDVNFDYKPESIIRIARVLEPFDLLWLETDMNDAGALAEVRRAVDVPICSGETLFHAEQYRPFFDARSMDVVMLDAPWSGVAQAKKVGDLAATYQLNVCPHNYYSHLSSFISAQLAAVLHNVRIMEFEGECVPWNDELFTRTPHVVDGEMIVPVAPGWGTDIDEGVLRRRSWDDKVPVVQVPSGFEPGPPAALPADGTQPVAYTSYDRTLGPWRPMRPPPVELTREDDPPSEREGST